MQTGCPLAGFGEGKLQNRRGRRKGMGWRRRSSHRREPSVQPFSQELRTPPPTACQLDHPARYANRRQQHREGAHVRTEFVVDGQIEPLKPFYDPRSAVHTSGGYARTAAHRTPRASTNRSCQIAQDKHISSELNSENRAPQWHATGSKCVCGWSDRFPHYFVGHTRENCPFPGGLSVCPSIDRLLIS